jgi:exonuclease SbcD
MRFIHLADLHLGKRVHEFSLIEDQKHMLESVLDLCRTSRADALVIAGDVYDRTIPSLEAIRLLETFLIGLTDQGCQVLMVAGNHDSGERLAFGRSFLSSQGVHVAGVFEGQVEQANFETAAGPVTFHLLPFIRQADVRRFFPDREINSVEEAVQAALSTVRRGPGWNILVAHQFVTVRGARPLRSDSEVLQVGLADEIDASLFGSFDYTALGHLHGRQTVGRGSVHYAGSPLAYSFSEVGQEKGALVVDLTPEKEIRIRQQPLACLHAMRRIRGSMEELLAEGNQLLAGDDPARLDYLELTLTDPGVVTDPLNRLRAVYPNVMRLLFDRKETGEVQDTLIEDSDFRSLGFLELFSRFFQEQTGRPLTPDQERIARKAAAKAQGEEAGTL